MLRPRALSFLVGAISALVLSGVLSGCDSGEDPTPVSTFRPEDPGARQIFGRVFRGSETVEGALVRVDAVPGFASDVMLAATSTAPRAVSTDPSGFYRVTFAPFAYDLSVRSDLELLVMRGLQGRTIEPTLGGDVPLSGFKTRVIPTTQPPPPPGHALTYLVSGPDARTAVVTPDSVDVTFRKFDSVVTLHAFEYVAARGLVDVVRAGRVDVRVREGEVSAPVIAMADVTTRKAITFTAAVPPGYTIAPLEIEVDTGLRKSAAAVTSVALGSPVELSVVPGAVYTVRTRATSAGAVSSSGRIVFDLALDTMELELPLRVASEAPIDDDLPATAPPTLEAGGALAARFETGIIEHVLTPAAGGSGPMVRVVTGARTTTLPDATQMGLTAPAGRYEWTIEHFPTVLRVENLSGPEVRVGSPSWRSAPKIVVLR